jgi:membrane protease YdiL (CAAX protease family)
MKTNPILELAIVFAPIPLMSVVVAFFEEGSLIGGSLDALAIVLCMILATVMLRRDGGGWASMGLGRPKSWLLTIAFAFAVLVAAIVINIVVQIAMTIVLPAVEEPDHSRFDVLRDNLPMLLAGLVSVWVTAAFGEEMLVRGFMMNRLARLFGSTTGAWIAALLLSSVVFGLMHIYQGTMGVVATGVAGLLFGTAYLLTGRNLWVTILAHGVIDTLGFVMFYLGMVNTGE